MRMKISRKEAKESAYWLRLINETNNLKNTSDSQNLIQEAIELKKIFSTILEKSSDKFLAIFNNADLVISKGQGNLEGLINYKRSDLFFLLMVKCNVIARLLNVRKGDFVVQRNLNINTA